MSEIPTASTLTDLSLAGTTYTPHLTAADEKDLAGRILGGDRAARDWMIRANLPLVVNIARGYAGRGVGMDDLVAEGNLGLMRAIEAFDANMNTRFSTYASYWIKQSIQRGIINTVRTIRVPMYLSHLLGRWTRTAQRMADELGRPATPEEVAGRLEFTPKRAAMVAAAARAARTRSEGADDGTGLGETIADGREDGADHSMLATAEQDRIRHLFGGLTPREAAVLRMRFGLSGEAPMTFRTIGHHLGLSRERVRQMEGELLTRLRGEQEPAS